MMQTHTEHELKKLRWQCRRGMLEMDVLLRRYLDQRFVTSSDRARTAFSELLALEDDLLWDYMLGTKHPSDADQLAVLNAIRSSSAA